MISPGKPRPLTILILTAPPHLTILILHVGIRGWIAGRYPAPLMVHPAMDHPLLLFTIYLIKIIP